MAFAGAILVVYGMLGSVNTGKFSFRFTLNCALVEIHFNLR